MDVSLDFRILSFWWGFGFAWVVWQQLVGRGEKDIQNIE